MLRCSGKGAWSRWVRWVTAPFEEEHGAPRVGELNVEFVCRASGAQV